MRKKEQEDEKERKKRTDRQEADSLQKCRTLIKTQDYLDVFARFKNTENITAVERVLGAHPQLEPFEKSQLGILRMTSSPPFLFSLIYPSSPTNKEYEERS